MDPLGSITLFKKVVETGSFSEAGRQSNLAPSSVSRRIDDLEGWVGATLFYRTTRKLNLTEVGQLFFRQTQGILLDLEEARTIAASLEDKPSGLVRLTMPASLEQHIVSAVVAFQKRWPEVEFGLTATDRNVDMVAEGLDVAIRIGPLADSTLKARKLTDVRRRLVASQSYIDAAPPLETPDDIVAHSCLTFRRNPGYSVWRFSNGETIDDIQVSGDLYANSGNILANAALRGQGLLLSTDWLIGHALSCGDLVEVLPDYQPYPALTSIFIVHPYQKFVPPKVRVFNDFLIDHFGAEYDWALDPAKP